MIWASQQRAVGPAGLHYFSAGEGPALVLIHGVGLRSEAWLATLPALCARFRVYAVDMPGHGSSPMNEAAGLDAFVDPFATFVDALDGRVLLAGHSMGALIAMELAARLPHKFEALAALNAVYRRSPAAAQAVRQRAEALVRGAETDPQETLARWFGSAPHGAIKACADACRCWLEATPIEGYSAAYSIFAHSDGPSRATRARLACPALFLTGAEDPNSTPAMAQALAEAVAQGSSCVLPGAAHMLPMTHGDEVARQLQIFFENQLSTHKMKGS